jgi:hypothetical protein
VTTIQPQRDPVEITADEQRVSDACARALARHPRVFQRANLLVHVLRDDVAIGGVRRPRSSPRIAELSQHYLRGLSTEVVYWFSTRFTRSGDVEQVQQHPPPWAIANVHTRGHWEGVRPLEGVSEVPILRPDGTLFEAPGYDPVTAVVYEPACEFPAIPQKPTPQDAADALEILREPFCDFPFETPAHASTAIAFLLTPLARRAYRGPAPLFLLDANTRGSGKSLLADVVAEVATGRPMPRMPPSSDDEELRKAITSMALAGVGMVLIDNVAGSLGGPVLDSVITSETWRGRVLGESRDVEIPFGAVWAATGNNVQLVGDLARRTAHVRLESDQENPETRQGFKHARLLDWVRENRPRLVAAALTLLRAYLLAGSPDQAIAPWGSFDGWSGLIRQALVFAGAVDPGLAREKLKEESDSSAGALADLLVGWEEVCRRYNGACSVNQALDELRRNDSESTGPHPSEPRRYSRLRDALSELCPTPPGKLPSARSVGNKLRGLKGRVANGRKLSLAHSHTREGATWRVVKAGGDSGDDPAATVTQQSPTESQRNGRKAQGKAASCDCGDSGSPPGTFLDSSHAGDIEQSHYSHESHGAPPPNAGDAWEPDDDGEVLL